MKHNFNLMDLQRKLDINNWIMGKVVLGNSTTDYHAIIILSVYNSLRKM